jgi:formate dehydrogenase iron-sulfur subunit
MTPLTLIDSLTNAFPPRYTPVPGGNGDSSGMTGFFTDTTLCIGCKACEVACKQWNQLPADGFHFTGNSYDNTSHLSATTWRHVAFKEQLGRPSPLPLSPEGRGEPLGSLSPEGRGGHSSSPLPSGERGRGEGAGRWLMLSDVCKHCDDAPCEQSCPTGSIIYNQFGNVYVQPDICNGCGYCIAACPFGVLGRSEQDGHAHKCTLCYDRQAGGMMPACAKACPTASIQFGPLDQLRERAQKRVEELHARGNTDAYLYGAESVGDYGPLHSFFLLEDHPNEYNLPEQPVQPLRHIGRRYAWTMLTGLALAAASALIFRSGARHAS